MTTITSTVVHQAEIRFREANVALRPYVGCFWVISAERDAAQPPVCIWIGFGPKALASIVRFQATLKEIEHAPAQSGAALAAETGYFDQAHLTTNLSRFAGATPRHLASRCASDFYKTRCDDLP